MARILVTDAIQLGPLTDPDVQLDDRAGISREDLLQIVSEYDAIITRSRTQVDEELLNHAPRLKVIGRGGVGVDNIDIEAASRRGILVVNAPEANNVSAAELALSLMLAAARGVARSDRLVRNGDWDRSFLGRELDGARLGIVGLGRIGSLVARRAQGLGMSVAAYDPYITRHRADEFKVELFDDLHAMLARSDFLTVHTPLTEETKGIIGADELAALPRGAIVVNAARGGIVEEAALAAALDSGQLFAAGLDVYTLEPPSPDHPLVRRDDVVLTAHLGANTYEAQGRVGTEILERTVLALKGDYSRGIVNGPALSPDVMEALGDHLRLGEVLGRAVTQLGYGRVRELEIELAGDYPIDPDPIATAVLKGVLEPILSEPPNYINAPSIARERDIRVSKVRAARGRGYITQVTVTAVSQEGRASVGGTVLAGRPRITSIDGYALEIRPEGTMLVCTNYDRPGAVGRVGTVLGEAGVNINSMQLSRVSDAGLAMFILTLDSSPSEAVLEVLRAMTDVIQTLRLAHL
ncbi:MAG TPA: phosphoglycerate dehydrogenase [Trueperaceae bacterium]|nr:phosphoglycerate dehydrogenase [Trueperaceae bacterium]